MPSVWNNLTRIKPLLTAVGFILIVVLCVQAQTEFLSGSPLGFLWLGTAGILAFVLVAPVPPRADLSARDPGQLDLARWLRRIVGIVVLIIGVIIVADGIRLFHEQLVVEEIPNDVPWIHYGVGLVLAFVGALLLTGIGRLSRIDFTVLILVAIVVGALFVRVYQVDQYPLGIWIDEALYGVHAHSLLESPDFRPVLADNMSLPHLTAYAMSLQLFGNSNIFGMRLISALLASAGVIAAYLVGRELRGAWFGLTMALLLAALRWSINFSRIAMTGAELVTFTLLTFYAALRLARNGRLRDGLWFGIAVAAGVYFYRTYLVQLIGVGVYLLLAYPFSRRRWRHTFALGLTALLAAVILLLPLIIFAIDRSEVYFGRLNQVSIFNEDLPPDTTVSDAILRSTLQHLQMFHLSGDENGRHNLPGAPMLDPVTGSLLVIGLFAALRERRREHLFFALSIGAALSNGILSISFEAPQSLRTIGAITGVIYFAALGLESMTRLAVTWLSARLPVGGISIARGLGGVAAIGLLGIMATWNLYVYFKLQRMNLTSWIEFSTVDSLTGRFFTNYDSETQFYISPLIGITPSIQFLAVEEIPRSNVLAMPNPFPLRIPPTAQTVIMLSASEDLYLDYLRRLYPGARFHDVRPVDYGVDADPQQKLLTVIDLSPEDIGSIQGLNNGNGVLYTPIYDDYTFTFAPNVHLEIDGESVEAGTPLRLVEGDHVISVNPSGASLTWRYSAISVPEPIPLYYQFHNAVTTNGLVASFYDNADWEGTPALERIYPFIYQYIHVVPMDRPYSARYSGYIYAPETGEYRFGVQAIDTGTLDIDGENIIQTSVPDQRTEAVIDLEQGWHEIEVRHQDLTSSTRIYLTWIPPGAAALSPIERDYFCPTADLCETPSSE